MDQVHVIRHKVLVEGQSAREVAREMGVSRNTVRKYLSQAAPKYGPRVDRQRPIWSQLWPEIDELMRAAASLPRKQRLTATQVHRILVGRGRRVGATLVKQAVAEWKRQRREVYVPLVYPPGDLAEVDFFDVVVTIAGALRHAWMFVLRLMHSGRDFAWLYDRQDQVSFLDGHVRAFSHLGVVPRRVAYDNLRLAVRKILVGSERELQPRFEALASHYLLEPCFCRPATGHDKGGVEARGRGIRLQHLVPIPEGESLGEVSQALLRTLDGRLDGEPDGEGRSMRDRFKAELPLMLPLPSYAFDPRATRTAPVSRRSLVQLEGAYYSAPCEWNGLDVTAHIGAADVLLVGPTGEVQHPRLRLGQKSIDYRHYVRELARKPQAVRQVAAELMRDLGEPFPRVWRDLVDEHGPVQASRIMAKVLGQIEKRGLTEVVLLVEHAHRRGEPLLLALAPTPEPERTLEAEALPASLRDLEVSSGKAADYDALLIGGEA